MIAKKKILVVEDNTLNRMLLCQILANDYDVVEAENGKQALEILEQEGERISLILLDIVMPVMDGYTFLSIVKASPSYSLIPVIVTTQSDSELDEVAALSHGAADFVAKPYRPQIILHRVASIIHLRETAAMINLIQYDSLTGLYSKAFFYQRVKETLLQRPDQEFDIICSDIVNFKLINDIFGVPAGDRILCGIADLYLTHSGSRAICCRFNADQFACLLERRWEYTDEMFQQACAEISALPHAKNVVMKWGIYHVENRNIPVEQMCDRAILAARTIKGQYGKYFAKYDDNLRNKLLWEQTVTNNMDAALQEKQFEIYLQPKFRIKDNRLAGAEALVRWKHPEWGMQSPAQFIPLFERNGFITKLDQYVWDRACEVLQDWDRKGYPPIAVSVNVSRADIYNADLEDILQRTIKKYELPPARLHLEITESAYTETPKQIVEVVGHLRELGFIIEMDDFGAGYSSLNMLNEMPVDILKLDMKFIQSETAKPANQGILRFIISLARWMSLSVVAEGVETQEQLERLRAIGCDFAQGYYIGKPMPVKDFEVLLQQSPPPLDCGEESLHRAQERQNQILLLVDEDAGYRNEVRKALGDRFQIVEAADGRTALASIAVYDRRIAAAVLSMTLPEESGFEVLEALQREKAFCRIPTIATGPAGMQLEGKAFAAGADDFAAKPHLQTSLLKRIQHVIYASAFEEEMPEAAPDGCGLLGGQNS